MPTRNVVLTDRHENLIEALVQSGRYQNASEASKLEALRAAADAGIASLDRGEFTEFEDMSALNAYLDDLAEKTIAAENSK